MSADRPLWLVVGVLVVGIATLAMFGSSLLEPPNNLDDLKTIANIPDPKPQYKWFTEEHGVIVDMGGKKQQVVFVADGRAKISIKAESGVDFSVVQVTSAKDIREVWAESNVFQTQSEVEIKRGGAVIIWDSRGPGTALSAAAGAVTGSSKMIDRATAPNRVKVRIEALRCISACAFIDKKPSLGSPPKRKT